MMTQQLVLKNAKVFTSTGETIDDGMVVIENGKIADVGMEIGYQQDADIRSLAGKFLMPGFIDVHTHLTLWSPEERSDIHLGTPFWAVRAARDTLSSGVTTVRDMGGKDHFDIALRNAIARGEVIGPRMLVSGKYIAPTGGHVHYWARCADGPNEVRKAVREQIVAGADLIKLMVSGGASNVGDNPARMYMTKDEIQAAVEEATEAGKQVSAHVHPSKAIRICAEVGVSTLEHAKGLDEETIASVLKHETWVIPTQAAYGRMARRPEEFGQAISAIAQEVYDEKTPLLENAIKSGIKIGIGTDSCRQYPHNDFVGELVELSRVGMSNKDLLIGSTRTNSEMLGLEASIGTIEPGKVADLIVIDGNPIENLEDARNVTTVIQGGIPLETNALINIGRVA